jgi:hypothetical protein
MAWSVFIHHFPAIAFILLRKLRKDIGSIRAKKTIIFVPECFFGTVFVK